MKTRLINISHVQKYCDGRGFFAIISNKIPYEKIVKYIKNGRGVVRSVSLRHFDLQEAIKISEKHYNNSVLYKSDWKIRVEALRKVEQDFLKYGDMIPETSDVREITELLYPKSVISERRRVERVATKKSRRVKVIVDFNNHWDKKMIGS